MAFPRQTILAVLATSAALMGAVEAFAPPARSINIARTCVSSPVALSLTATDDDVATEEEPADYLLEAADLDAEATGEEEETPARFLSAARILELRTTWQRHEKDCGSPEFQVAGMTERISHLTAHLKEHPKDFSTRRGLVALVNKRRRLLNYLFQEDEQKYVDIVEALGIRHKVPGAIASKEDKYGRFPKANDNKGKSKMK